MRARANAGGDDKEECVNCVASPIPAKAERRMLNIGIVILNKNKGVIHFVHAAENTPPYRAWAASHCRGIRGFISTTRKFLKNGHRGRS